MDLPVSPPCNVAFNMDCMEGMRQFPDNYFDLAVVDPPYGLSKGSKNGSGKLKTRILNNREINEWDNKPNKTYFDELFRVSKNQVVWGGNYFGLPGARCVLVWDKLQPWENFSQVEIGWTSFDKPAQLFKYDNRTGDKIHPTQKPVPLYDWVFSKYSNPGDLILDTHLGSGSSRIAADRAGLSFVGFEIDKDYFEAQEKRFREYKSQMVLF